jgi:glycine cleavage system H protein
MIPVNIKNRKMKDLKYTKDHEWIKIEGDTATVGITDFAQSNLGDIVYVELEEGLEVEKDEVFGSIEAVKTVSDLFIPMSGEVIETNETIEDSPELVNSDPYGEGWLVKVQLSKLEEVEDLLSFEEYEKLIK